MAGLPALRRASLRRETMAAKAGAEAEVPPTDSTLPLTNTYRVKSKE
jgi:hypothetical protein